MDSLKLTDINNKIDDIIKNRHENLREITELINNTKSRISKVSELKNNLNMLLKKDIKAGEINNKVSVAIKMLDNHICKLNERLGHLNNLYLEFNRDTLNIGVSGEARSGKSLTLQKVSGLTNKQIPTGSGLPVTAVRSVIYNGNQDYAMVTFRSEQEFISDYLKAHLDNINKYLEQPIQIESLGSFEICSFPESLKNADNSANYSLQKLIQAQNGINTYKKYLTGETKSITLDKLKKFVSYPTDTEEENEKNGVSVADRSYLAVNSIEIYCKFPALKNSKIALVDLPGLGEVGKSVAEMHLNGLESKVDQIFLIMKATTTSGFVGRAISDNLENLSTIQPGVKYRSDLISPAINIEKGIEENSITLKHSFNRDINKSRPDYDKYALFEYDASDEQSVSLVFDQLLEKIAIKLPDMDKQKLEYVKRNFDIDADIESVLNEIIIMLNNIQKSIPKPEDLMYKKINEISGTIIHKFNNLEYEFLQSKNNESDLYHRFHSDVEKIHETISNNIEQGLFLGNFDNWDTHSKGQSDYLNFYRDDAKRIKREIMDAYNNLDEFYSNSLDEFKIKIINAFINNAGNIRALFDFKLSDKPEFMLDKIIQKFDGSIAGFDSIRAAFEFLRKTSFSFRSHVILQIEKHLDELSNPLDTSSAGTKVSSKSKYLGDKAVESNNKIDKIKKYLISESKKANDDIKTSLLGHNDSFNEVLSNTMTFFVDDLFRKNESYFSNVVIRSLINNYRIYFFEKNELETDPYYSAIEKIKEEIDNYFNYKIREDNIINSNVENVDYEYGEHSRNFSSLQNSSSHKTMDNAERNVNKSYSGSKVLADNEKEKTVNLSSVQKKIFEKINIGDSIDGVAVHYLKGGVLVDVGQGLCGLLNVQNMSPDSTSFDSPKDYVNIGDKMMLKVIYKDDNSNRFSLSLVDSKN